jgi:hypothetical protein
MKIKSIRLLLIFVVVLVCLTAPVAPSRSQRPKNFEKEIDALLAKMTLDEKLGQLQQLDGEANGNFRPEHLELVRQGSLGSTLNVRGAQKTNELQRIAVTASRLKIPLIFGFDVIHGYRTVFPIPLGEAASWDPAAVERSASIAAAEARAAGVHWTFAPMVDIARDPRWGRIRIWARLWPARVCADFRELTTARRTRSSPAPSIGWLTARRKRAATTTPRKSRKEPCAKFTFRRLRQRQMRASALS